jgi:hypothetical protein
VFHQGPTLCVSIELWRQLAERIDCPAAVDPPEHILGVERMAVRPGSPSVLDTLGRVDKHTVEVEQDCSAGQGQAARLPAIFMTLHAPLAFIRRISSRLSDLISSHTIWRFQR